MLPFGHVGVPSARSPGVPVSVMGPANLGIPAGPRCTWGGRAVRATASQASLKRYLESRLLVEFRYTTRTPIGPKLHSLSWFYSPQWPASVPKPSPRPPEPATGPNPHSFAGYQLSSAGAEPSPGGPAGAGPLAAPGSPRRPPDPLYSGLPVPESFLLLLPYHTQPLPSGQFVFDSRPRQHPSLLPTANNHSTTQQLSPDRLWTSINLHHISGRHHGVFICTTFRPWALDREKILSHHMASSSLAGWPCLPSPWPSFPSQTDTSTRAETASLCCYF